MADTDKPKLKLKYEPQDNYWLDVKNKDIDKNCQTGPAVGAAAGACLGGSLAFSRPRVSAVTRMLWVPKFALFGAGAFVVSECILSKLRNRADFLNYAITGSMIYQLDALIKRKPLFGLYSSLLILTPAYTMLYDGSHGNALDTFTRAKREYWSERWKEDRAKLIAKQVELERSTQ